MTSKKQPSATSKISAASFPLGGMIFSMEPTSQPEGARFTIRPKVDANCKSPLSVVVGRIMMTENGTTLFLGWSDAVIASETVKYMEGSGYVVIAIAQPTSK